MITRDGNAESLWQHTVPLFQAVNRYDASTTYDVIIIGGGITGLSTALLLQQAGKKCLLLEAHSLCYGTTGGSTAHINTLLDHSYADIAHNFNEEAARQLLHACRQAIATVKNNIRDLSIDCQFEEADAFLFATNEKQVADLHKIAAYCNQIGLEAEDVSTIPLSIPFINAVRVKEQAKFNPVRYSYGLAVAYENAGGVIMQHCRVKGLEEHANEVVLQTSAGTFKSPYVVISTHIPFGVNLIHLRCVPFRSYAMAFPATAESKTTSLLYDLDDPYHYYRSQVIDQKEYFIIGGFDHKTGHEDNCRQCFRELEAHAARYFKFEKPAYQWSSQYYEPADGLPYIGEMPGQDNRVLVTTGFGGNGITYSQVAASVIKNILCAVEDPLIKLFNPNRIKPVAGFKNFISHNADMVKQFANKFFSTAQLNEWAALAPGEAGVYKWDTQKIAVFKDDGGALHAINPNCTHFNCSVKWNNAERSWDCPCHGARFSLDGEVLNGPASVALEKLELKKLLPG